MKLIALLIALFPLLAFAQEKEQPRTISTNGEAVVYVVPDEVIVNLGIETFSQNLDKAKTDNDDKAAQLLKAVRELKVEDKHIGTDVMSVDLRYRSGTHLQVEGYVCRRTYSICLKDVKLFEKLIDTAIKNGANQIQGVDFRSTELRKHRDQARKLAIKAAKEKAVDLAAELECKVGKPRTVSESMGYYGYGNARGNYNAFQNSVQVNAGGEGGESVMPLGQIAIRANVNVVFDLVP